MILFSRERIVPNTACKHTLKIIFYPSNQKIKTTSAIFHIFNELKNILLDPYESYSFNCILFRVNLLHLTIYFLWYLKLIISQSSSLKKTCFLLL